MFECAFSAGGFALLAEAGEQASGEGGFAAHNFAKLNRWNKRLPPPGPPPPQLTAAECEDYVGPAGCEECTARGCAWCIKEKTCTADEREGPFSMNVNF